MLELYIYHLAHVRFGMHLPSGRKKRIMIACVTFETSKVVEPALYYEVNRIHIIRYLKDPNSDAGRTYDSFCRRVCERLESESPRPVEIEVHNERVSDFPVMLRTVLSIIQAENREDECEIYVNISSGSPEYSAASAVASMMVPGTIPFSVGTQEYTVSSDRIKDVYFVDGEPVGLTKSTYPPRAVPVYSIQIPEEHLVRGLRVLDRRSRAKQSITSGGMIPALKEAGIWYRDTETDDPVRKENQKQTEAVYYQRDFISKWVRNGWIQKDDLVNKYVLTDEGHNVINTFYLE